MTFTTHSPRYESAQVVHDKRPSKAILIGLAKVRKVVVGEAAATAATTSTPAYCARRSISTRGYVPHADSPTVDQRGVERPQGALVDGQLRCDIGAVER